MTPVPPMTRTLMWFDLRSRLPYPCPGGGGMRIAVYGTGGVGGYFGGRLAEAGHRVAFIARGAHLEAIRRDGLAVESIAGSFRVHPAEASDDPARVGPVEVVLVCVK